jgi:ornithine cyclodeaminase/alanine dehydrogenase-like protein (mu-crystallin family)
MCGAARDVDHRPVFPGNAGTPVPTHQAVIAVFDPATGVLTALMDGDVITAMRTAAGSALSTRLLARADARVLTVLGTGPQARAHALLTAPVRAFDEVRVAGRDPAKAAVLAGDLAAQGLPSRACGINDAIEGADVVCATTSALDPIVHRDRLRPGAHVASVGYTPHGREVDLALYGDSLVVVVLQPFPVGSNDIIEAIEVGLVTPGELVVLGEVVEGRHPGRTSAEKITLYKSVGVAVQDAAAAAVVLAAAQHARPGRSPTGPRSTGEAKW